MSCCKIWIDRQSFGCRIPGPLQRLARTHVPSGDRERSIAIGKAHQRHRVLRIYCQSFFVESDSDNQFVLCSLARMISPEKKKPVCCRIPGIGPCDHFLPSCIQLETKFRNNISSDLILNSEDVSSVLYILIAPNL